MPDDYYFDERIAEAYDADVAGSAAAQEDVPFYVQLAAEAAAAGQAVFELGCGTGRVAIPMAQAGARVVGLDNSPAMLAVARRKAQALGVTGISWVEADMASFVLGERFGLIVIPLNSFLLLLSGAAQKACLDAVLRHLEPSGRLALAIFNPATIQIVRWSREDREVWLRLQQPAGAERGLLQESRIQVRLSEDGAVIQRLAKNLRLRWVYRHEMEALLTGCGLEVEALYGGFDQRPFAEDSQVMVWVARRPPAV